MHHRSSRRRGDASLAFTVVLAGAVPWTLTGCPDERVAVCARLCDRTVLCVEKHVAPLIAAEEVGGSPDDFVCRFDDEPAQRSTCEAGCLEAVAGPTAQQCAACLADHLTCAATASVRRCDVDCEPTSFVTGADGEGAPTYDYASWFFTGIAELDGLTCTEQPR